MSYIATEEEIVKRWLSSDKKIGEYFQDKWVSYDNLMLDLRSILEAEDYAELKQCISDLINELEEETVKVKVKGK